MAPYARAEAIAKIRALAQDGRVLVHERVQRGLWGYYTVEDVEKCVCGLGVADYDKDEPPDHPDLAPKGWVYMFRTTFGRDVVYVKVILFADRVLVLSFRFNGRAD